MQLSFLERCLRLFTDVRPGEGPTAVRMFANVFLILCAYYLIKPLREGWIAASIESPLEQTAAERAVSATLLKAYTSFGQAILLVPIVAWYSRLVNRLPRGKLITVATLFCMSNLLIFWFLQPDFFFANLPFTGVAFYLWVGMFGVFVVAQFWAFAADVYSDEDGRRLIPLIAIGATAGGVFGSTITEFLVGGGLVEVIESIGFEPLAEMARRIFVTKALLLLALVPLGISIFLTRRVDRDLPSRPSPAPGAEQPEERSAAGGMSLVLGSRFLLAVAIITVILNWVNTNGENLLTRVVQEHVAEQAGLEGLGGDREVRQYTLEGTTAFYGAFFGWVNGLALLLQSLVASRLLKYGGFGAILMLLPVVAMTSYAAMLLVPILAVVAVGKAVENAADYSINNTARHVLWLPIPSDVTFKGKPAIDTLFARVGDGLAAFTVFLGLSLVVLPNQAFAALNVFLVLIWVFYALRVLREHRRLCEEAGIDATA